MDNNFVSRWVVQIDDERFLVYDDPDDVDDWSDTVLEIRIPSVMAGMLDYTQHSYYTMQQYLFLQWTLMQEKLGLDDPGDDAVDYGAFNEQFEAIVRENNLKELGEDD